MYIINGKVFTRNDGINTLMKEIKTYLHDNQLVLTNDTGIPLVEEEITNIISTNPTYTFDSVSVSKIEVDFVNEISSFVVKVEKQFNQLTSVNDKGLIINGFIEFTNSLIEIERAAQYFDINFIKFDQINEIASKVVSRVESNDLDFVLDIMEYELIPILQNFKERLLERQYQ